MTSSSTYFSFLKASKALRNFSLQLKGFPEILSVWRFLLCLNQLGSIYSNFVPWRPITSRFFKCLKVFFDSFSMGLLLKSKVLKLFKLFEFGNSVSISLRSLLVERSKVSRFLSPKKAVEKLVLLLSNPVSFKMRFLTDCGRLYLFKLAVIADESE